MTDTARALHPWKFFRAGGFDQVRIDTGADLAALPQLDQKLWVALACPTRGLEFDIATLDLVDSDKDGRIRVPEILDAVKWALARLRDPDALAKGGEALPLDAINEESAEGKAVLASAKQILENLGRGEVSTISLEDTKDTALIFAQTRFNGDGIIPADAADDEAHRKVITELIELYGAETDRSGKPGTNQAKVDTFFAEAQAYADWWAKAEGAADLILPLGEKTAASAAAVAAVRVKVDDYFARCNLAAFDPRAAHALNRSETEYVTLAQKDLSADASEVASFPLAHVAPGRPLPLGEGVNPAWAAAMNKLRSEAVGPLLGDRDALAAADWKALAGKLAAFEAWNAAKAGGSVEKLGLPRVRELLASDAKEVLTALVARDRALEPEASAIADVDKLVRYFRDLAKLLRNFVNFSEFYGQRKAIWQAGTLYIDQKSCELCLPVDDPPKHAAMAGLAATYLLYLDCVRKTTGEKLQILAAITDGDTGNLMVGRNGVFYDRKGKDFDATITKIIENPISLRQAFWAPYKKLVRMIEEQVAKRAAAAEASSHASMQGAATAISTVPAAAAAAPATAAKPGAPPLPQKKVDVGVVAALGVAVGAIGTAVSAFATGLMQMPAWQLPLLFVGLMLLISGPSILIAWLKLRRRNLGPILDANGWAVNTRARVNIPFGTTLTELAQLPPGSKRELFDPYAEKKSRWPTVLVVVAVLGLAVYFLNKKGLIFEWTRGWIGSPPSAAAQMAKALQASESTAKELKAGAAAPAAPKK